MAGIALIILKIKTFLNPVLSGFNFLKGFVHGQSANSRVGILLIFALVFIVSCNHSNYYPKPRGFFRIDFPEKNYRIFDSIFPYKFEYPVYAQINFDKYTRQHQYWMNLDYPGYNGRIHISYKSLENHDLYQLTEDTHKMAFKHAPKAIGIKESLFINSKASVYGLAYKIEGSDAASPFQFYVTDSTHHFLRGALYFNVTPNNDSLQPVIDFILNDIDRMLNTFEWKTINP